MALKPLTLEQLISIPLRALVVGQEAAAQATADFVSDVGFEKGPGKSPIVRHLEFEYSHPVPDPSNPGGVIETPTRVRIPLLAMFSVPNVSISEATVAFGANIVDMRPTRKLRSSISLDREETDRGSTPAQVFGEYAPAVSSPGQPAPTLTVSIKVTKEHLTEGLVRVLDLLSDAITSVPKPR